MTDQRKNIALLGSTGSIGRSTLDVAAAHPDRFRILALSAWQNVERLASQARQFRPRLVCIGRPELEDRLKTLLNGLDTGVVSGPKGMIEAAALEETDMVVSAVVGGAGFTPTYHAIRAGKDIALANKETLVMGGRLIIETAKQKGIRLLPVDSEHNALHQSLKAGKKAEVSKLILTASGGPFLDLPREDFEAVTPERALRHPTWKMGPKITIDSATLMNKGLEVIEASYLFDFPPRRIDVVVHPQSVVHSLVEYVDGSIIGQLGPTDMRLPIQYCLTYPERLQGPCPSLALGQIGTLTFRPPDMEKFPCLKLAYEALETGGTATAVLNAANETAVQAFLDKKIGFTAIPDIIEKMLDRHEPDPGNRIEDILEADRVTREAAGSMIAGRNA
jgi:1-deoxy-D-xylulose-5-phosphate reductoisomerase